MEANEVGLISEWAIKSQFNNPNNLVQQLTQKKYYTAKICLVISAQWELPSNLKPGKKVTSRKWQLSTEQYLLEPEQHDGFNQAHKENILLVISKVGVEHRIINVSHSLRFNASCQVFMLPFCALPEQFRYVLLPVQYLSSSTLQVQVAIGNLQHYNMSAAPYDAKLHFKEICLHKSFYNRLTPDCDCLNTVGCSRCRKM